MARLADVEVPIVKAFPVQPEEVMQQGIQNSARIVGGEQGAGFNGNDNEPENRGDPRLQKTVPVAVQWRGLLDAIVGSLSRDHDIMNVALAKSSTTNANEAGFLQKFGNGGATAVAHA